jgi:hypothetical protein
VSPYYSQDTGNPVAGDEERSSQPAKATEKNEIINLFVCWLLDLGRRKRGMQGMGDLNKMKPYIRRTKLILPSNE